MHKYPRRKADNMSYEAPSIERREPVQGELGGRHNPGGTGHISRH